jgi:hypothetical protein
MNLLELEEATRGARIEQMSAQAVGVIDVLATMFPPADRAELYRRIAKRCLFAVENLAAWEDKDGD